MSATRQAVAFAACDAIAYAYHRAVHATDVHMQHHREPENMASLLRASALSAAFVAGLSRCMRTPVPLVYWSGVTAMHPLLHTRRFEAWPMSYVQRRHDLHHAHGDVNFGPVTPVVDLLMNTERR